MKNWLRHLFEELGFKKKRYPRGEAWYSEWSTRFWHFKQWMSGYKGCIFNNYSFLTNALWLLTGYTYRMSREDGENFRKKYK